MADRSKRHLERVLRECAEAGVPGTASPWPEIRERVAGRETDGTQASGAQANESPAADAPSTRRPLLVPDRPLGWALAVLSVLILGMLYDPRAATYTVPTRGGAEYPGNRDDYKP